MKAQLANQKIDEVKEKKQQLELEKRKKSVFLLHRWDFIKEKRREMFEEAMFILREKQRKLDYIRLLKFNKII